MGHCRTASESPALQLPGIHDKCVVARSSPVCHQIGCQGNAFGLLQAWQHYAFASPGHEFQALLTGYGMQSSMSRKGNCWDNASTESLWGSLKVGRLHGMRFDIRRQAMDEVIDWLTFYNDRRFHSTLGYISPMRFENNWFAAQLKKAT